MTDKPNRRQRLALAIARLIAGPDFRQALATVDVRVDDSPGWQMWTGAPNERDAAEIQELYRDALEAWRKNPMAKRVVDCTSDYTLGDGMEPTAAGSMGTWIKKWWEHPKNNMLLRLPDLSDELTRAGDLFITLHRNPDDGMSYIRPIPKDRIVRIETLPNDWETEIAFYEVQATGEPRKWLSPNHPDARDEPAIMVHYAVNRVVGALMGEGDITTMLPWLLRYSRFLEDRTRMHFAARAFLWLVTVPTGKVEAKTEQYKTPPPAGSVVVKDATEEWMPISPDLKGFDAHYDARSLRQMIDAGSGLPPHWRGEAHDVSLATARAMENSASRHLRRRQLFIRHMVTDLTHIAYTRAWEIGRVRARPNRDKINVPTPDIARTENLELAQAAKEMSEAMSKLYDTLTQAQAPTLKRRILEMVFKIAGQPLTEQVTESVLKELEDVKPQEEDTP